MNLDSERQPEIIAKSIIDVAKNQKTKAHNLDNKALNVNEELSKICREANFLTRKNINLRTYLNK